MERQTGMVTLGKKVNFAVLLTLKKNFYLFIQLFIYPPNIYGRPF